MLRLILGGYRYNSISRNRTAGVQDEKLEPECYMWTVRLTYKPV